MRCSSAGWWQSVGSCGWVTGIFSRILCFCLSLRRKAAARQRGEWKPPPSPGSSMKVMRRQNRWRWDGEVFLARHLRFLMLPFVVTVHRPQLSSRLGFASGRSSWNNTAAMELRRVYDLGPAVNWSGSLCAFQIKPDYTVTACVCKWTSQENSHVCMWCLLLSPVSTETAWKLYSSPHTLCIKAKMLLKAVWCCGDALGVGKYFIDRWHKVMTAPMSSLRRKLCCGLMAATFEKSSIFHPYKL